MTWIVVFFGALVAAVGAVGAVRPGTLLGFVDTAWRSPAGYRSAVALRLALGLVLLAAAPDCRYPLAIRVLGGISLVAALTLVALGRARVEGFIHWWRDRGTGFVRSWCVVAIAFGVWLAYAAL